MVKTEEFNELASLLDYVERTKIEELINNYNLGINDNPEMRFVSFCEEYNKYRKPKLNNIIYPSGILTAAAASKNDSVLNPNNEAIYETDGVEPSFENGIKEIKENVDNIRSMEFNDKKSIRVLFSLLNYRLTGDKSVLFMDNDIPEKVYFDKGVSDCFDRKSYDVLIDGGAYIGDTIYQIRKKGINIQKIYAYEASRSNYGDKAICINKALGNKNGFVNLSGNEDGVHVGNGNECVEIVTLDESIVERIDFIKLDVEGCELDTLRGGAKHIVNDKPLLAISAYHKLGDYRRIYYFLKECNPDYCFSFRHYGESTTNYVLYAY